MTDQMPAIPEFVNLGWFDDSKTLFRARELAHGRSVAVRLLGDALDTNVLRQRAVGIPKLKALAGELRVPAIHSWGLATSGDAYVALELAEGGSLADRITTHGRLPLGEMLEIAGRIADALVAAHEVGLVHGRLGPEHVVMSPAGEPQLTGLDRSALLDDHGAAAASVHDDITALGHTMLLLLGVAAHDTGEAGRALDRLEVPAAVAELITRCTADNPRVRPSSMAEVTRRLTALRAEMRVSDPAVWAPVTQPRAWRTSSASRAAAWASLATLLGVAAVARTLLGPVRRAAPWAGPVAEGEPSSAVTLAAPEGLGGRTMLADDLEGLLASATPEPLPYGAYARVTDDTNSLHTQLPIAWADIDGRPSATMSGRGVTDLRASTDLEAMTSQTAPGVVVNRLTSVAAGDTTSLLLDDARLDLSTQCRYLGRRPYSSPTHDAQLDVYEDCGPARAAVIVLSAMPEDRSSILRVRLTAITPRDLDALDRILDSQA